MSTPNPSTYPDLPPMTSAVPPGADVLNEEMKQEVTRQASAAGATDLSGLGEVAEGVVEIAGAVVSDTAIEAASAAVEVGGEVVGGAMEALGSGLELAGGCAEGCSLMIAVVVLLATAGSALAFAMN